SLLIILLISVPVAFDKNALKVTFLDVGQGDSVLVELPDKRKILIDGGGIAVHRSPFTVHSFDIGRRVVAPYLYDRGIRHIDYLVLTHPHPDHVGGLVHIVKEFSIGEVWTNGYKSEYPLYIEFRETLKQKGIRHRVLWAGSDSGLSPENGYQIYILHPHKEFTVYPERGEFSAQNNLSLVIKVVYKNTSFLFTGDIEEEAEAHLIQLGKWVKSNVIKVPHHGGKTSSTEGLLYAVSPQIAVVHAGKNNPFGHPNPAVIERYRRYGVKLYRTDMDGAVRITSDGRKFETLTYEDVTMVPVIRHYAILDELKNIKRLMMRVIIPISGVF
ncbi:MAG: ComEC/Rec2 family competence protein, partial [Nitrospirota bacterium]